MITAEDVLTVLNGLESVALADLEFAVAVEEAAESFSVARQEFVPVASWFPFEQAEIVVVSRGTGREPFGEQRKPGKWSVRFEYFDDLAAAQDCRDRVLAGIRESETAR